MRADDAEDPAIIVYTSGTTGNPKGVLYAHRVLLGHLPGVELPHEFFPQPGDRMWTPADWAWAGGLMDALLPSLFHGVPVVAKRLHKFDPEEAFSLLGRHRVRNSFMPPTAPQDDASGALARATVSLFRCAASRAAASGSATR